MAVSGKLTSLTCVVVEDVMFAESPLVLGLVPDRTPSSRQAAAVPAVFVQLSVPTPFGSRKVVAT